MTRKIAIASIILFMIGFIGLGLNSKVIFISSFSALYAIFMKYSGLFRQH